MKNLILVLLAWCFCAQAQGFEGIPWYARQENHAHEQAQVLYEALQDYFDQHIVLNLSVIGQNRLLLLDDRLDKLQLTYFQNKVQHNNYSALKSILSKYNVEAYRNEIIAALQYDRSLGFVLQCYPFAVIFPLNVPMPFTNLTITHIDETIYRVATENLVQNLQNSSVVLHGIDCFSAPKP